MKDKRKLLAERPWLGLSLYVASVFDSAVRTYIQPVEYLRREVSSLRRTSVVDIGYFRTDRWLSKAIRSSLQLFSGVVNFVTKLRETTVLLIFTLTYILCGYLGWYFRNSRDILRVHSSRREYSLSANRKNTQHEKRQGRTRTGRAQQVVLRACALPEQPN